MDYKKVTPIPVTISKTYDHQFEHAVMLGGWRLQWNGQPLEMTPEGPQQENQYMFWLVLILLVLAVSSSFFRVRKTSKGIPLKFELKTRLRDCVIAVVSFAALIAFFVLAKNISPDFLEKTGYAMPLPLFTFVIAIVDGFNPCNMFVLTCLLAILISTSDSRKRLYVVAFSFVGMVFLFYFTFMAAWLNVFKVLEFMKPLRMTIGVIALIAGLINCKELLFFRKGISLMIQDKHKGPLMQKIQGLRNIIAHGSFPLLVTSSLSLAALASLIELPCTAGFPIIYTGILSGKGLQSTFAYYIFLFLYNIVYVLPLLIIITIFIYTFRARQITQRQMEIIKFVGGVIMILLGILLLVNPGLLGLGIAGQIE